jgi:hypothetical protein
MTFLTLLPSGPNRSFSKLFSVFNDDIPFGLLLSPVTMVGGGMTGKDVTGWVMGLTVVRS